MQLAVQSAVQLALQLALQLVLQLALRLAAAAHFVLVPGPNDPTPFPGALPKAALLANVLFSNRDRARVPTTTEPDPAEEVRGSVQRAEEEVAGLRGAARGAGAAAVTG